MSRDMSGGSAVARSRSRRTAIRQTAVGVPGRRVGARAAPGGRARRARRNMAVGARAVAALGLLAGRLAAVESAINRAVESAINRATDPRRLMAKPVGRAPFAIEHPAGEIVGGVVVRRVCRCCHAAGHSHGRRGRASVACEPQVAAWGGRALLQHCCEVVQRGELTLITASLPQTLDLPEGGGGLLLVHQRIPVRIDGSDPPGRSEELERAECIGQRVAVSVGAPKKCCAGLAPVVAGRP